MPNVSQTAEKSFSGNGTCLPQNQVTTVPLLNWLKSFKTYNLKLSITFRIYSRILTIEISVNWGILPPNATIKVEVFFKIRRRRRRERKKEKEDEKQMLCLLMRLLISLLSFTLETEKIDNATRIVKMNNLSWRDFPTFTSCSQNASAKFLKIEYY